MEILVKLELIWLHDSFSLVVSAECMFFFLFYFIEVYGSNNFCIYCGIVEI